MYNIHIYIFFTTIANKQNKHSNYYRQQLSHYNFSFFYSYMYLIENTHYFIYPSIFTISALASINYK